MIVRLPHWKIMFYKSVREDKVIDSIRWGGGSVGRMIRTWIGFDLSELAAIQLYSLGLDRKHAIHRKFRYVTQVI